MTMRANNNPHGAPKLLCFFGAPILAVSDSGHNINFFYFQQSPYRPSSMFRSGIISQPFHFRNAEMPTWHKLHVAGAA